MRQQSGLPGGPLPEFEALLSEFVSSAGATRARTTWQAYGPAWARWQQFCAQHGANPYATTGIVAAAFLTSERLAAAQRQVGPQAVERASAAITAHTSLLGITSPCASQLCSTAREVARRTLTASHLAREPVSPADVHQLLTFHITPTCDLRTRMYVTCAALCYYGMLRYSDLANVMVHADLMRFAPGRVELYLWRSKTDQHAVGATVTIMALGGAHCPVHLLRELLVAGGYSTRPAQGLQVDAAGRQCLVDVEDVGPLLRAVKLEQGRRVLAQVSVPLPGTIPSVQYSHFKEELVQLFRAAGITKPIGTHSLRSGGASAAVNGGADRALVQKTGRWRSPQVMEQAYVREAAPLLATLAEGMRARPAP